MIDTADLPVQVRSAVEAIVQFPASQQAAALRGEGAKHLNAGCTCWQVSEWAAVVSQLGLAIGYLTAAQRVEEPS